MLSGVTSRPWPTRQSTALRMREIRSLLSWSKVTQMPSDFSMGKKGIFFGWLTSDPLLKI